MLLLYATTHQHQNFQYFRLATLAVGSPDTLFRYLFEIVVRVKHKLYAKVGCFSCVSDLGVSPYRKTRIFPAYPHLTGALIPVFQFLLVFTENQPFTLA